MRAREAFGFSAVFWVGLAACYDAPTGEQPCSITCVSECPGDLTCKAGFCVGDGEECTAAFTSISVGGGFACALDELSDLWCWGNNDFHQLDPGDEPIVPAARRIATGRKYQQVSAGRGHVCAISDGQIYCWGANDRGQISGGLPGDVIEPTRIETTGGPAAWSSVGAGFQSTCAIADDGRLFCWGRNDFGQLGNGGTVDAGAPTPIRSDLTDWSVLDLGGGLFFGQHACAVSASQGLFCWGGNGNFQLADAALVSSPVPVPVALPDVTSLALGAYSSCAISAGDVYCWGFAGAGSLGDPTVVVPDGSHALPVLATNLRGEWTEISAGEIIVCGLRSGAVYCWGATRSGAGIGSATWQPSLLGFTQVVASGAERVAVGFNEALDRFGGDMFDLENGCLLDAGAIKCWGDNRFGQLGQGAAAETAVPLEIAGGKTWTALATGRRHTCGVDAEGQLSCWGSTLGAAVDGTIGGTAEAPCTGAPCDLGTPQLIGPADGVAVGIDHTCSLAGDQIACWGDNSFNQHGMPVTTLGPSTIPGSFTQIFDMHGHSTCGRTSTDITCWGNFAMPTPVPELAAMTSVATGGVVAAGNFGVACFLDTTGTLFCSGNNSLGQYGNGPACAGACVTCGNLVCDGGETTATCPGDCGAGAFSRLRSYTAFSIGWDLDNRGPPSCGVLADGTVECWGRNPGGMISKEIDPTTLAPVAFVTAPQSISGLTGCTDVSVGHQHACARCNDDILCWGDHSHGAVGSGPQTFITVSEPRPIAVKLDAGDQWAQLTSGAGFSCARSVAGRGYCWGGNQHGALGLGAAASTIPIVVRSE
ncbi:MAG: hypothetical protein H0V17_31585 [Deltaproteobacteria bacterium]|nr:hypothetical protein [Deltaproteobacteria bacterium]